ncbi:prepilin peptidase [Jeotgalibacillus aurantiacus]|uniref:prepilin peptidase n=1 Tax=Jeotgalibacillus aurantiacus TaxID=2763266 RepID=UPI001D0BE261|nr:A24 family peptidase [Jeotgalibacillus aurantiacus]
MTILFTGYFTVLGLIFGSFFNVAGLRIPKKQSIVSPGSSCPVCRHKLRWFELIPFFSYLIQKGVCRSCGTHISAIYPVMELITGISFGYAFYTLGFSPELAVALVFISLLVIISVSDMAYMLIPDKILLFFAGILIPLRLIVTLNPWWDALAGAAAGFGLLFFIAILSKGGMGGGDIKLYGVIGLVLGVKLTLLSFFFATLIGTVAGLFMIVIKKKSRKEPVPFGPSIAAGSLIAYFFGEDLIRWYFSNFIM